MPGFLLLRPAGRRHSIAPDAGIAVVEMTETGSHEISPRRLTAGIVIGAAVPIGLFAFFSGPGWKFVIPVGIVWAIILVPTMIMPAYRILKGRGILTVFWAMFLGGLAAALPLVLMTAVLNIGGSGTVTDYDGRAFIDRGKLTAAGWYTYFVLQPLFLFPLGAIGGLLAWLIAVGWRFKS